MKNYRLIYILVALCLHFGVNAQTDDRDKNEEIFTVYVNGEKYDAIVENGDTILFATLDDVSFTAPPTFKNDDYRRRYMMYKRYAGIVYPYAVKAVRIFRETEYVTDNMSKRKRRKHIKRLEDRLEKEFEEPLKKLTKIQGMMLTKMIERELDEPMYDLIAGLKGNWTATYYSTMGLMFNYNLRRGYREGDDPLLDIILKDFDISYDLKDEVKRNREKQKDKITNPEIPIVPRG